MNNTIKPEYTHYEVIFMWKKIKPYVISVLISVGVGVLSAFLIRGNTNIYEFINKPPLSPPSWLFGIVWTILFILMGISSAIIYTSDSSDKSEALGVYAFSLILNFFWSIIFFNMQAYLFAFIWILFLWISILYTIVLYSKIDKTAAYLQIPYLVWVTFAAYLNLMIYILN